MEQTRRQKLESHLAARALEDPDFRGRLLRDPKQTIEEEIGLRFPAAIAVHVHEEKLTELHVVLPVDLLMSESLGQTVEEADAAGALPFWKRVLRLAVR